MKGNSKVIAALNEALKAELTAISQYILHAEMCQNWGYERLHAHTKMQSIEEMKHAEDLIERDQRAKLEQVGNMLHLALFSLGFDDLTHVGYLIGVEQGHSGSGLGQAESLLEGHTLSLEVFEHRQRTGRSSGDGDGRPPPRRS